MHLEVNTYYKNLPNFIDGRTINIISCAFHSFFLPLCNSHEIPKILPFFTHPHNVPEIQTVSDRFHERVSWKMFIVSYAWQIIKRNHRFHIKHSKILVGVFINAKLEFIFPLTGIVFFCSLDMQLPL